MRTSIRARRILPLAGENPARSASALDAPLAVIDDGVIIAENGRIHAVESYKTFRRRAGEATPDDLGEITLAPGLVNCHTHLEFSHLGGKTLLGKGFLPWLHSLRPLIGAADEELAPAVSEAAAALRRGGTAHVADIVTRRPDLVAPAVHRQNLGATLFLECIRHDPQIPKHLAQQAAMPLFADSDLPLVFSLAGHALYSTSGENLIQAKAWCDSQNKPFSLHLAEHAEEVEFLQSGSGAFAELLYDHLIPRDWPPPRRHPVAEARRLGLLGPGTLAVHCVQCGPGEVAALAESDSAVCLCPRSNAAIGVGDAPARAFAEAGALLVLGTDSLVSNCDLDLWGEIRHLLQKNLLPANALLRMATVNGAGVLGLSGQLGTLDRGTRFCYSSIPNDLAAFFG